MTMGNDLQSAVAELGRIDSSRLTYGRDYSVDLQVGLSLCSKASTVSYSHPMHAAGQAEAQNKARTPAEQA